MGFTHYYTRTVETFDPKTFKTFVADCKEVCLKSEIPIAGWSGTGKPKFTSKELSFNGVEKCGHRHVDLGITWPSESPTRGGIDNRSTMVGQWYAGAALDSRRCDGRCSHETFRIAQTHKRESWDTEPEIFSFCKTAYKPYDILVTACLIIAKHYFGPQICIGSDGESLDWQDARNLCQHILGYGGDFQLEEE